LKAFTLLLAIALPLAGCRKQEAPKPRTEPWENPAYGASSVPSSSATPPSALGQKYTLDAAASRVTFSLPAKGGTPRGSLSQASGTLILGSTALTQSRAELSFDLTSITLDPVGDSAAGSSSALDWLELGTEVKTAVREQHRRATFVVSKLTGFGEGSGKAVGKSLGSARGELSLHGFRVPLEVALEVERQADEIVVRTRKPLVIKLAEHDIVPRGPAGERRSQDLASLGTTVGREIKVECELSFRPDQ
jgi:polyisoprenoid-binding protein YceI